MSLEKINGLTETGRNFTMKKKAEEEFRTAWEKAEEATRIKDELASLEKSRILLVDDEEMMRKLIMDFLKTMDLEIIEAENGKEAISILDRIIPHLILLDIRMPEMHGFQLLDYVRNNPKTRSIPVIMMTVDDDIKTREEAFRKGANGFITKPVAMEELFPMVGRFFSGRV